MPSAETSARVSRRSKQGARPRRTRTPKQTELVFRTWGGARAGAGAKAGAENVGLQPHVARPAFVARIPVHATMRVRRGIPSLRSQHLYAILEKELRRVSAKGFRLLHFSIQDDHLHLIAEGDDGPSFSRGIQCLASRIARLINEAVRGKGTFWRERYFRRDLTSPRQYRNAVSYVLQNFRKHAMNTAELEARRRVLDGYSSAIWFDDWEPVFDIHEVTRRARARAGPCPVVAPMTWLARAAWKVCGLIRPDALPKGSLRSFSTRA